MNSSPFGWGIVGAIMLGGLAWVIFDDTTGRDYQDHLAEIPEMTLLGSHKIENRPYYFYEFTADDEYCIFVEAGRSHGRGIGLSCREVK